MTLVVRAFFYYDNGSAQINLVKCFEDVKEALPDIHTPSVLRGYAGYVVRGYVVLVDRRNVGKRFSNILPSWKLLLKVVIFLLGFLRSVRAVNMHRLPCFFLSLFPFPFATK